MTKEDDFGWIPPSDREDPYDQSLIDLWIAFENRWTPDGILEFKAGVIMDRFKDGSIGLPAFKQKQLMHIDRINRNGKYPDYHVDNGYSIKYGTYWYQRFPRKKGEDVYTEKRKEKQPFYREGDQLFYGDKPISSDILKTDE